MKLGKKAITGAAVSLAVFADPLLAAIAAEAATVTPSYAISVDGDDLKLEVKSATLVAKK